MGPFIRVSLKVTLWWFCLKVSVLSLSTMKGLNFVLFCPLHSSIVKFPFRSAVKHRPNTRRQSIIFLSIGIDVHIFRKEFDVISIFLRCVCFTSCFGWKNLQNVLYWAAIDCNSSALEELNISSDIFFKFESVTYWSTELRWFIFEHMQCCVSTLWRVSTVKVEFRLISFVQYQFCWWFFIYLFIPLHGWKISTCCT